MINLLQSFIFSFLVVHVAQIAVAAEPAGGGNPYAPRYGHPYRHGAVPTREAAARIAAWTADQPAAAASASSLMLAYAGGVDSIGVTSGKPKVYLVVYGSQWGVQGTDARGNTTLSGDHAGAVPYLQMLFKGLGTGAELWSGVLTQYCDGPQVLPGAMDCPASAAHIAYPSGGALAGVWYHNSVASPVQATSRQLALEAIAAAKHFGNTTPASNRYAQYVILSPSGAQPDGFNTPYSGFCAWHSYSGDTYLSGGAVASPYGDVAFTNMPYVSDDGGSCMAYADNSGSRGALDGVSSVEGPEYAETLTDPTLAGWYNQVSSSPFAGEEIGDECSGVYPAPGFVQNVVMGNGTYAMQTMWSNDTAACEISHAVIDPGISDDIFASGFQ
jgi:serine protease